MCFCGVMYSVQISTHAMNACQNIYYIFKVGYITACYWCYNKTGYNIIFFEIVHVYITRRYCIHVDCCCCCQTCIHAISTTNLWCPNLDINLIALAYNVACETNVLLLFGTHLCTLYRSRRKITIELTSPGVQLSVNYLSLKT